MIANMQLTVSVNGIKKIIVKNNQINWTRPGILEEKQNLFRLKKKNHSRDRESSKVTWD